MPLDAHDEQQEHDTEFGQVPDLVHIVDQRKDGRPDKDARDQETGHGTEAGGAEERYREHGRGQQDDDVQ